MQHSILPDTTNFATEKYQNICMQLEYIHRVRNRAVAWSISVRITSSQQGVDVKRGSTSDHELHSWPSCIVRFLRIPCFLLSFRQRVRKPSTSRAARKRGTLSPTGNSNYLSNIPHRKKYIKMNCHEELSDS